MPPGGSPLACGDVILTDTTLHADLLDCDASGLVIGADGIALNLNGHTVGGNGVSVPDRFEAGVLVLGRHHVRIIGPGTVQGFIQGVHVERTHDSQVVGVTAEHNVGGISTFNDDHNAVRRNTASHNDFVGIALSGTFDLAENNSTSDNGSDGTGIAVGRASNNTVRGNVVSHNGFTGIHIDDSDRNVVTRNFLTRNVGGMVVIGSGNRITDNVIADVPDCGGGCGFGLSFEGGTGNELAGNIVDRAAADGIRINSYEPETPPAVNNVVRGNIVRAAGVDGIAVATDGPGRVTGTRVQDNLVLRSGDDGIDVRSAETTISGNRAFENHDLGIAAVAGVLDGGRNRAHGNGNRAQCVNVVRR
jgi:parallel beta-helix repeat protein